MRYGEEVPKWRWRVAEWAMRWLPKQCWSDLVDWAMRDPEDDGARVRMPWAPARKGCYDDARSAGRCYCGVIGSDGVRLRRGESVCTSPMPGRERDRVCSRPDGHDGLHRCGGVEWGRA